MGTAIFRPLRWHLIRFRSGSDQVLTAQTCPWLLSTVDYVLRVIAMFTVNLFSSLVSSKHEGLSPEWWSYQTRECCFSQSQRHLCDFIWLLLRRSLLNPRLLTFWNFLPSPVGPDWWDKHLPFQNGGNGVKGWWKNAYDGRSCHLKYSCTPKNQMAWEPLLTSHTNISLLALYQLVFSTMFLL